MSEPVEDTVTASLKLKGLHFVVGGMETQGENDEKQENFATGASFFVVTNCFPLIKCILTISWITD